MKFVIFGLTVSSAWSNEHATVWRGLSRALMQRGHRVVFFERDQPCYAAHRDFGPENWSHGRLELFSEWSEELPRVRRHLADADVAIVTSYCPDALAATAAVFESSVPLRVFYDLDTPVTLHRIATGQPVDYIGPGGLAGFELVLSFTGGPALEGLQSLAGARRVGALHGCVDPAIYDRGPVEDRFQSDLCYLGSFDPERRAALETLFVGPARARPERRFVIGGAHYPEDFPWTANMSFFRRLEPSEQPLVLSASRLSLHVTGDTTKAMGYCPSSRLFEAAACGVPLISDGWPGLELFFEPGAEILVARTSDDVMSAMELPELVRTQMAKRARERTLDEHTSAHRARHLELILENTLRAPEEEKLSRARSENLLVEA